MVGIVVITHSRKLTDEVINFASIFKDNDFKLLNGTDDSLEFGTSLDYVIEVVKKANEKEGVLIFADLGSSVDIAVAVKEKLNGIIDIKIANAPLLEGVITAVAANDLDMDLITLKEISEDSKNFKKGS